MTEDEVALVLRRAAAIDAGAHPGGMRPTIDVPTLEAAAQEVGLSPVAVRQAVAELRRGELASTDEPERCRPGTAVITRVLPLPPGVVAQRLDEHFQSQYLRPLRTLPPKLRWNRRGDFAAGIRRSLDFTGRLTLNRVQAVEATLTEVPGVEEARWTRARIAIDLSGYRLGMRLGLVAGPAAVGGLVTAGALVFGAVEVGLTAGGMTGVASGGGYAISQVVLARYAADAKEHVEAFLDTLDVSRWT